MSKVRFEFVVPGPPFSVNIAKKQPKKHREWKELVARAARTQWQEHYRSEILPTTQPIEVTITTYYTALARDVDNVIKPILDSLKNVIYKNDDQVYRVISQRFDLKIGMTIEAPSAILSAALARMDEVVQIELTWEESEA